MLHGCQGKSLPKKTLCLPHKTAMRCANIKQAAKVNLGSVWVVHGWGEAKMRILCLGRQWRTPLSCPCSCSFASPSGLSGHMRGLVCLSGLRGKPFICRFTYARARTSLNFEVILARTKADAAAAVAI